MDQNAQPLSIAQVKDLLIVTLPPALSEQIMVDAREQVGAWLVRKPIRAVLFDLSAVPLVDGGDFEALGQLAIRNKVLGSSTTLIGIQPGVAAYLASLPVEPPFLNFAQNMASALRLHG
ncbi:MAG: STAS domain-containing protein [Synechococcaceae cyanobacterium ELA445]|jgi:anti-anti-sigma regulatory factor